MTDGPPFGGLFRLGALSMGAPSGTHSFVHQYPALWQLEIKSPLLNDDHVARAKRGEQRYTPVNPARSKCSAREKIGKHDVAFFFSGSMITSMILSWKCGGKFRTRARRVARESRSCRRVIGREWASVNLNFRIRLYEKGEEVFETPRLRNEATKVCTKIVYYSPKRKKKEEKFIAYPFSRSGLPRTDPSISRVLSRA